MTGSVHFKRVALIGIGLIGSSLAHVLRRDKLADRIVGTSRTRETLKTAQRLGLVDEIAEEDRKSTRLNSSHIQKSRMPSSA